MSAHLEVELTVITNPRSLLDSPSCAGVASASGLSWYPFGNTNKQRCPS